MGVGGGHLDGVGEQRAQAVDRGGVEGRWVEGDSGVVENGESGVEVVEARVDQPEADHRHADRGPDLPVCARVGAKTVSGQQDRARHEDVTLAFVGIPGAHRVVPVAGHPLGVGVFFGGALRKREPGDHGLSVDQHPPLAA